MVSPEKYGCVEQRSWVETGLREGGGKGDYLKEKAAWKILTWNPTAGRIKGT